MCAGTSADRRRFRGQHPGASGTKPPARDRSSPAPRRRRNTVAAAHKHSVVHLFAQPRVSLAARRLTEVAMVRGSGHGAARTDRPEHRQHVEVQVPHIDRFEDPCPVSVLRFFSLAVCFTLRPISGTGKGLCDPDRVKRTRECRTITVLNNAYSRCRVAGDEAAS